MTETTAHPLAQVAELDEERQRYEGWLAQLDARRDSSPEHVYTRVRADYEARLQGVLARLAEHAETLRAAIDELSVRVAELQAAERQRNDERAEAELRHMVGEYSDEQWFEIESGADEALRTLAGERGAAEQELAQLQEMLARATTASPHVTPVEEPVEAPPALEPVAPPVLDATPARSATPVAAQAVPETPAEPAAPVAPAAPAAPVAPVAPVAVPGAERRTPAADQLAAVQEPQRADEVFASWSRGLDGSAAGVGREPTPSEGVFPMGDDSSPQIKTLKCQECGTMNYPTEWYCERCGGELATL